MNNRNVYCLCGMLIKKKKTIYTFGCKNIYYVHIFKGQIIIYDFLLGSLYSDA